MFLSILKITFLNCLENFAQSLRKFYLILKENFTLFLRKFYSIFNKISHNFQENFSQLLRELHLTLKKIFLNFLKNFMYVVYLNAKVPKNLCTQWTKAMVQSYGSMLGGTQNVRLFSTTVRLRSQKYGFLLFSFEN